MKKFGEHCYWDETKGEGYSYTVCVVKRVCLDSGEYTIFPESISRTTTKHIKLILNHLGNPSLYKSESVKQFNSFIGVPGGAKSQNFPRYMMWDWKRDEGSILFKDPKNTPYPLRVLCVGKLSERYSYMVVVNDLIVYSHDESTSNNYKIKKEYRRKWWHTEPGNLTECEPQTPINMKEVKVQALEVEEVFLT